MATTLKYSTKDYIVTTNILSGLITSFENISRSCNATKAKTMKRLGLKSGFTQLKLWTEQNIKELNQQRSCLARYFGRPEPSAAFKLSKKLTSETIATIAVQVLHHWQACDWYYVITTEFARFCHRSVVSLSRWAETVAIYGFRPMFHLHASDDLAVSILDSRACSILDAPQFARGYRLDAEGAADGEFIPSFEVSELRETADLPSYKSATKEKCAIPTITGLCADCRCKCV